MPFRATNLDTMVLKDKELKNIYEVRLRIHLPDHSDEERQNLVVRLYDEDLFNSECLTEAVPEEYGYLTLFFEVEDNAKVPYDGLGNLYFVVVENEEIIYKSQLLADLKSYKPLIDFPRKEEDGHVICMGSFAVRRLA